MIMVAALAGAAPGDVNAAKIISGPVTYAHDRKRRHETKINNNSQDHGIVKIRQLAADNRAA
jgi:hypothetical protein